MKEKSPGSTEQPDQHEIRKGWRLIFGALIGHTLGLHTLPPYTSGLFLGPLHDAFGWSRSSISFGVTIATLGLALSSPIIGGLADRLGERTLIVAGLLGLSASHFLLSVMGSEITMYWSIMGAMAILGAGCAPVTLSRVIVHRFSRRRGTALGLALVGTGLTGSLAPVLLAPIIAKFGWRAGYCAIGLALSLCLPLMLMLLPRSGPADPLPAPLGPREPARVDVRILIRLSLPVFCVAFATGGVVIHFVPMLTDAGRSLSEAAPLTSTLGLSLLAGRVLTGFAVDRLSAPHLASALMSASAAGFVALAAGGPTLLPWTALLLALSLGAELDLIAYLASRCFDRGSFGRAFGSVYATFLVGVALSPLVYGIIRDWTGNYRACFLFSAAFLALSAVGFSRVRLTQLHPVNG